MCICVHSDEMDLWSELEILGHKGKKMSSQVGEGWNC